MSTTKVEKERPESVTSAHAWLHERIGIPITYVRKNAAPWLWMYKHWRYLPANPDRPYPFYANVYRPFEVCSNAIGLGVSQKVTKRTKAEFGVNADTSFPSVNLFWFAAVAASPACNSIAAAGRLRRGALGSATPGTATAAFAVLRRAGQRRGYKIGEPKW